MKLTIYILVFFITHTAIAQNSIGKDKTLPMVGYWHIGAKRNVKVTQNETFDFTTDSDTVNSSYNAEWQILDSTAKYYTVNYTVSNFYFSTINDSFNQLLNQLLPAIAFKYKTNELGNFDSIINYNEIKETLYNATSKISQFTQSNRKNNFNRPFKYLNLLFESFLLHEIPLDIKKIHHFYGLQYKKNTAYTYDTILKENANLSSFKAKSVFKLTNTYPNLDKAKFTCVANSYKEIDLKIKRKQWRKLKNSEFAGAGKRRKIYISNIYESQISILEGYPIQTIFTYKAKNKKATYRSYNHTKTTTITFTP